MALHFLVETAATASVGGEIELTGAEAHHAATVRRVREGERITLTDGRGAWVEAEVLTAQPQAVRVRVTARRDVPAAQPRLVLAQALAKGDRDELAVQAATELGVDEVIPWQAARSVSRWEGKKRQKGRERWASIVREAAKQAHRAWLPIVAEPVGTGQLAERARQGARLVLLDPWTDQRLVDVWASVTTPSPHEAASEVILVVGPEGGIAPEEIDRLTAAGAVRARLGTTVLRTSTAGPAALAVLNAELGRW